MDGDDRTAIVTIAIYGLITLLVGVALGAGWMRRKITRVLAREHAIKAARWRPTPPAMPRSIAHGHDSALIAAYEHACYTSALHQFLGPDAPDERLHLIEAHTLHENVRQLRDDVLNRMTSRQEPKRSATSTTSPDTPV